MSSESIKSKLGAEFDRRWRTSVRFRYLFLAFIGLGILAVPAGCLIVATVFHNPGLGIGLMFLLGGGTFLCLTLFGSLRRGVISVGKFGAGSIYYRDTNPLGFWFYISFFTLIFLGVTLVGLLFVTHPSLLNNKTRPHQPDTALEPTQTTP